jgi:hypothetical protein
MPTWPEVEASFSPDGALRDIYVHGTELSDWERLIERVRTAGPTRWTVDGIDAPPMTARACFLLRERASVQLDLHYGRILLCTHFFVRDEIEFDLDPRDVCAETWPWLVSFLRLLSATTGKRASITPENVPTDIIARCEVGGVVRAG